MSVYSRSDLCHLKMIMKTYRSPQEEVEKLETDDMEKRRKHPPHPIKGWLEVHCVTVIFILTLIIALIYTQR